MGWGFPGVYANDLQMPYLSPAHVAHLLLPVYARVAREAGPLIFSLNCADPGVMREALAMPGLLGCAFDKRLRLPDIAAVLGEKLFVINHYIYRHGFDRPTLHDGAYCNPIVQTYSREVGRVVRAIGREHSLFVGIERRTYAAVRAVRARLQCRRG